MPDTYGVTITPGARQDLRTIARWIAEHDSRRAAEHVLDSVLQTSSKLSLQPDRGSFPPEMLALGLRCYRQVFFKPYRVIYRVVASEVRILVIADSRRDLTQLLERRLLGY